MVRKVILSFIIVLTVSLSAVAQNKQIVGRVFDEDGVPVYGATVIVEHTTTGTVTDGDGAFSLSVPATGVISVSYIGYQTQTKPVEGTTEFIFTLQPDATAMDDVIVVAFGTAKKEAFTGSAKVIESDELSKVQSTNVAGALVGRVSGVQTTSSSGSLDSSPTIRVRGFSSINASQDPLWVVDGVPFTGDLNTLNMADVETMTVLKDAASNALYGSRGANGVIMVTTKKAKHGEAVINFDAKIGVNSKATKNYDVISDPGDYYEAHYKALYNYQLDQTGSTSLAHNNAVSYLTGSGNGGLGYCIYTVPTGETLIGTTGSLNPDATLGTTIVNSDGETYYLTADDWMDEAYQTGIRQEYNVSVSASNERSSFFASLGYLDNGGIIKESTYERLTGRLKADYQAKEWLKVGGNMSYTNYSSSSGNSSEGDDSSTANIFAFASNIAPIYPVYLRDADGNILQDSYGWDMYDYGNGDDLGVMRPVFTDSNALQTAWLNKNLYEGNAMSASGFADFYLSKALKLTLSGSTSVDEARYTYSYNQFYGQFASSGGSIYVSHSRNHESNLQQLLSYNFHIGDSAFDVMAGHEYNTSDLYYLQAGKSVMFSYDNLELAGAVVDAQSATSYTTSYNTEGYFARLQFENSSKYYASASFRRDASSRFHPDHRWGNFWSVGGAWILSKEDMFAGTQSWLDMLKYKISYGSQGNDGIGDYLYTDTYSLANNDGQIAIVFNSKGNEDITWETNANFNTGFEFSLKQGRFGGSIDYFNRVTSDMLTYFTVPVSLGYTGYYDNVGDMMNQGIEIELYTDIIRTQNFRWSFDINMSFINNKITRIADANKTYSIDGYEGYVSGNYFYAEGLPLYTFYMYDYAGVDKSTGQALYYYDEEIYDASGELIKTVRSTTTEYSEADRYIIDTAMPDLYGGFSTSIAAFGFDASIAFTYQIGGLVYDSAYQSYMSSPTSSSLGNNYHVDLLDAWTPDNPDSDIPRFYYTDDTPSSSRFLTDASYLNISNINVGYTFPQSVTRSYGINTFRIYLACDNVAYWSQRQGLDPRYSFTGTTTNSNYAPIRTISGGINVVF
ncbi:MAG: SusC/RagA family TonB-linked outer membrane protein [Rikenellaceae bacterium]